MRDRDPRARLSPGAVGQNSPEPTEEARKERAGRGFAGWVGTAAGVFSVVLILLAIFLVVIFVAR